MRGTNPKQSNQPAPPAGSKRSGALSRLVPILNWAPKYHRAWLRSDLIAGLTVAALVVPKSLGYAGIVGVPIQNGLYAAAAGSIIYAFFGTARQISTGPSSALAALAASALLAVGVSGGEDAIQIVAAITLLSGVLYLLLAVLRMGWLSQFLSKAVITGFLFGAAIEVVIGELPKITATSVSGDNAWQKLGGWIQSLGDTDYTTLLVGVVSLFVIIGLRFAVKSAPGALVLVAGGIVASWLLDLGDAGVALVGEVPSGLIAPSLPDLGLMQQNAGAISIAAVGLVLIGFSQTAGDARAFAAKHRYDVDINQESVAQGMANLGSSAFQGIPVSTSLSASSLNDSSGAKTPFASLMTGLFIILTLLFLAPLFSELPQPVLAALIIDAVVFGMMDVSQMRRLYRVKRLDFWIAVASIGAVLAGGVLAGVTIGVAFSIIWLIYVNAHPSTPELGRLAGTQVFRSLEEYPEGESYPGLLVLRFDGGLYFVTADALEDRLREVALTSEVDLTGVVLDFEGVNFIDSQGAAKLHEVLTLASEYSIAAHIARIKPQVLTVLRADGVLERLGDSQIHLSVHDAVEVARSAADGFSGE
jgi:sulfate permease, SulP family